MTETISATDSQAAESPHLARPETDAAAREIQDCVTKILSAVDRKPAAG
jgi:hypothetical protein